MRPSAQSYGKSIALPAIIGDWHERDYALSEFGEQIGIVMAFSCGSDTVAVHARFAWVARGQRRARKSVGTVATGSNLTAALMSAQVADVEPILHGAVAPRSYATGAFAVGPSPACPHRVAVTVGLL